MPITSLANLTGSCWYLFINFKNGLLVIFYVSICDGVVAKAGARTKSKGGLKIVFA
jgi:hypothetical protein